MKINSGKFETLLKLCLFVFVQVCEMLGDGGRYINDSHVAAPVYIPPLHSQWIAFEDETSVAIKV